MEMGRSLGDGIGFLTNKLTRRRMVKLDSGGWWRADISLYIKQYVLRGSWWLVLLSSIGSLDVLFEYGINMHAPIF